MADFKKVKEYLYELGYEISREDAEKEIVVISDERMGIKELIIDCEAPIIVFEQFIFRIKDKNNAKMLLRLLQMNRALVHGAFVVDEDGERVLFRDTLQLENLDLNEIKGSIDSLSIALVEFMDELLEFAK